MFKKTKLALRVALWLLITVPIIFAIRSARPWLLVRWGSLNSSRIGHFAANTELYLCERDAGIGMPRKRHMDFFFPEGPVSNQQLAKMWKRVIPVFPDQLHPPINWANRLIPGGAAHIIGDNVHSDRDVHNLLDRYPPHLEFSIREEARGLAGLEKMGIPMGSPFICLIARDSAYLQRHSPQTWNVHNYRDSSIQNYILAAEALAERGYFVIRMGAMVREAIKSNHPNVIDYASNGMRSDFMDVYLGAKCEFCISGVSGFEAVPVIFRRPVAWVNMVPFGLIQTFRKDFIGIPKHYLSLSNRNELSLSEIFNNGIGFYTRSTQYESDGIQLVENTPEEIKDLAIEMIDRLNGTWQSEDDDDALQKAFWEIFPTNATRADGSALHGNIRSRCGAAFLRNNPGWLQ